MAIGPRGDEVTVDELQRLRARVSRLAAFLLDAGLRGEATAAINVASDLEALESRLAPPGV